MRIGLKVRRPIATVRDTTCHNQCDQRRYRLGYAEGLAEVSSEGLRSAWHDAGSHGVFRFAMPREHGGYGTSACEFVEEMLLFGEHCRDSGLPMAITSQIWTVQQPLIRFATPELAGKYLPQLLAGDMLGAFALTEPNAGSDALALQTNAERVESGYLLNGRKAFIGMGPVCDIAIVFAKTAPEKGRWGLSAFVVEASDKGFVRNPQQEKLGLNSTPIGDLEFDNCLVPASRRIGPEGAGASIFQTVLDWERCFILTAQVGAMRRQLNACADYAVNRHQFGKPVADFQSVSNRLADMRLRLETSELMLRRAAELYDAGSQLTQFAAMANLHVSESFLSSSMDAMRTFGGRGYLGGAQQGTDLRDALGGVIYSGTSDIQREVIARMELGQRSGPRKEGARIDADF